ncbi:MAG: TlpA disulfide reductase family protein [Actinobacteria bacterium]|nr:TlpA disulfide reductase family protein [Actinomycetota bacterium]
MLRRSIAAIFALFLLAACSSTTTHTSGDLSYVAGDGSTIYLAPNERGGVVTLSGRTLDDANLSTRMWLGHVVVVNMWASWCGPCRSEATALANSYKELHQSGVEFVGLNTRDGQAAASAFNNRFPTGYPSIQDQDGQLILQFGNLGPAATPSTIILDREGRIAARVLGPVTQAQLRGIVSAVIEDKAS